MKHIFVINPVSGHQNAVELIPIIEAYFKDRQNEFEIKVTQYPKHATEIAASYHVSDEVIVYACGGDGTANEVLNGLAPDIPMAIIPSGTGNDFYRMFSLKSKDPKQLLIETIEGKNSCVDCGIASGKRFLNCSTMGFDADVGAEADRLARQKWLPSSFVYLTAVLKILTQRKALDMTLDFNGQTLKVKALIVAVMNGRFYGGGFIPTPMANIQDGVFDLCVIEDTSLVNILTLLPKYMKGTHINESIVRFYKTSAIRIRCQGGASIQTDGELTQLEDLDIRMLAKGLKIRVPLSSSLEACE